MPDFSQLVNYRKNVGWTGTVVRISVPPKKEEFKIKNASKIVDQQRNPGTGTVR